MNVNKHFEAIQLAYKKGRHAKGFNLALDVNGNGSIRLDLSGFDSMFLGLALQTDFATGFEVSDNFTLKVNNDVVIDNASALFFQGAEANPRDFVSFMRPISGNDDISLSFNGANQANVAIVVYYLGSPNLNQG